MKHIALLTILSALPPMVALAETHEVQMYTRNDQGAMIYEPEFLKIAPGDAVRFIPVQAGHNAAIIDGMLPQGAAPFKSQINEDFTVTLTVPGSYGIKCSPHFAMGMVMLIQVGDNPKADLPRRAKDRFTAILARETE
jgi:pseudoazurin